MKPEVFIIGSLKLQNELMAWFLEQSTGLRCACAENTELPHVADRKKSTCLILWDCKDNPIDTVWDDSFMSSISNNGQYPVALFNVRAKQKISSNLFRRNIRGVFFEHDPLHLLPKGIQAIVNGDMWFSREVMTKCLLEQHNGSNPENTSLICITPRENEILRMIRLGNSNDNIAAALKISPHTVKTHLHNIYKKINVSSRMQASLWAVRNL